MRRRCCAASAERGAPIAPVKEPAVFDELASQRPIALFGIGWLLFSFPLLALWDRDGTVFGLPLFPFALFAIWAALIGAMAWIAERSES
jgi:hypothetical protein